MQRPIIALVLLILAIASAFAAVAVIIIGYFVAEKRDFVVGVPIVGVGVCFLLAAFVLVLRVVASQNALRFQRWLAPAAVLSLSTAGTVGLVLDAVFNPGGLVQSAQLAIGTCAFSVTSYLIVQYLRKGMNMRRFILSIAAVIVAVYGAAAVVALI